MDNLPLESVLQLQRWCWKLRGPGWVSTTSNVITQGKLINIFNMWLAKVREFMPRSANSTTVLIRYWQGSGGGSHYLRSVCLLNFSLLIV